MSRFIHVGFHFHGLWKTTELEPTFATIGDWVRYNPFSWLVWTNKSPAEIYSALAPYISQADHVLIAPIDTTQKQGWMPKWIWDWIDNKQYSNQLGLINQPNALLGGLGALGDNPFFPKK